MSILMTPYEKTERNGDSKEETLEDLMIFGYHCKLYRDDVKAELENGGSFLIPWVGDSSLMIDRYDIRNHFDDKVQFGIKPNLPYHMTPEEEQLEMELDIERYKSLGNDISEEDIERELEIKQNQTAYNAVPFSYDTQRADDTTDSTNDNTVEHPPTATVDIVEDEKDMYYDPPDLNIPFYIERPYSKKFQSLIERTAKFISSHGQQMEIIIKTKQKYNGRFSFLHHEDRLFPYYKHLLHAIVDGSYVPKSIENNQKPVEVVNTNSHDKSEIEQDKSNLYSQAVIERKKRAKERRERKKAEQNKLNEEQLSDEEDSMELHPLLRTAPISVNIKNKITVNSDKPLVDSAPPVTAATSTEEISMKLTDNCTTSTNGRETVTTATTTYPGYDVMSAYYHASQEYQKESPTLPPPPDVQPIVDKTADYVAKNGSDFEKTVIMKHLDDRRFDFLHPWNQYHKYYKSKLAAATEEIERNKPLNLQKLNSQGGVSFKLASKPVTTLQLPIGVVDLHYEEDMNFDEVLSSKRGSLDFDENKRQKKQKLSVDSGGQIDGEFKKFLSTVKTLLS